MNTQIRGAVLSLVASFIATFAFLWPHREPVLVFLDAPLVTPKERSPTPKPPSTRPAPKPEPVDAGTNPAFVQVNAPSAGTPSADEPPLPLMVSVTAAPAEIRFDDTDGAPESKTSNQVEILNTSDQLLAVTVIDVNLPSKKTSSTQILLPPNGQAHIGAEASLAMESGDAITLRSSGFRDISQTVP